MSHAIDQLTEREAEVLRLLLNGHTAKSVAAELNLSIHTVNDYLREARKKLGVSSSREAARISGEQEATAHQKNAPEQIGMENQVIPSHNPKPSTQAAGNRRLPWLIGGTLMIATAIAAALVLASTGSVDDGEAQVETTTDALAETQEAALGWVALIDEGNYNESWVQAGPLFRSAVTAEGWAKQVAAVREPLGEASGRTVKSIDEQGDLPGAPAGEYRIVTFDTDFENSAASVETVIFRKASGSWAVVGYFIR